MKNLIKIILFSFFIILITSNTYVVQTQNNIKTSLKNFSKKQQQDKLNSANKNAKTIVFMGDSILKDAAEIYEATHKDQVVINETYLGAGLLPSEIDWIAKIKNIETEINPDIYFISLGMNDNINTNETYMSKNWVLMYEEKIKSLLTKAPQKIVWIGVTKATVAPLSSKNINIHVIQSRIIPENIYIDLFVEVPSNLLAKDGVHLNTEGTQKLLEMLGAYL